MNTNQLSFILALLAVSPVFSACSPDTPEGYFCCKPSESEDHTVIEREIRPAEPDGGSVANEPLPAKVPVAPVIPVSPPPPAPACAIESFRQPVGELTRGVDILFVTDTSGSLKEERLGAAEGILNFVDQLPSEMNYRIGVVLAHGQKSPWFARLFKSAAGESEILESSLMSRDQIQSELRSKLTRVVLDYGTEGRESKWYRNIGADAGEAGLLALENFVKTDTSFIRKDAALAVVFLADENDICSIYPGFSVYPAGKKPVPSPGDTEGWFQSQGYCDGITPDSVLGSLVSRKKDYPLLLSGILYDSFSVPSTGQNEYGYGYMDLIKEANGISTSIAEVDKIPQGLGLIGKLMNRKLTRVSEYRIATLGSRPVKVTVDGREVMYRYSPASHSVVLSDPGEQGSEVEIKVCQ